MSTLHTANRVSTKRNTADLTISEFFARMDITDREALFSLGELLNNRPPSERERHFEAFAASRLGVAHISRLVAESFELDGVSRISAALAVAELLAEHRPELGPGSRSYPPEWETVEIAEGETLELPCRLAAWLPAGTLSTEADLVLQCIGRKTAFDDAEVSVFARPGDRHHAAAALTRIRERGEELNPFRGRVLRASPAGGGGLRFDVVPTPDVRRQNVIVAESVWAEVDLNISAVAELHAVLNTHGLGARRGVLLCGPPGVGKSALCASIAAALVGPFTVIYADARAGASLLARVVNQAVTLAPAALILEDLDLYVADRRAAGGTGGLAGLLEAMDIAPDARVLTLATTNDATVLDAASIRCGRFDSIVEIPYPDRAGCARILASMIHGIPGGDAVDVAAVAAALPPKTSGADVREVARRGVLAAAGGPLTTAGLVGVIGAGRWRPALPGSGQYL